MRTLLVGARLVAVVLVGLVMLLVAYLFRSRSWHNEELGEFEVLYRWGRPRYIQLDVNYDGRIDARYRISGPGDYSSSHWKWDVGWESSRCDEMMDVHLRKEHTDVLVVAVDTDRNGDMDFVTRGPEAETYLRDRPVHPACDHRRIRMVPRQK